MHPEDKKIAEILSDYCRTLHIAKKGRPFGDVANGMREGAPSGGNIQTDLTVSSTLATL